MERPGCGYWASEFQYDLPDKGRPAELPGGGMPGPSGDKDRMRVHFLLWHVLDTVMILEEGNFSHPQRARYDILVPRRALNGRHLATENCARGEEWKRRRLTEAETR